MENLLYRRSVGGILTQTFAIYGRNFAGCLLAVLPLFPLRLLLLALPSYGSGKEAPLAFLAALLTTYLLVVPLVIGLFTFLVGDLCLGRPASVLRAYRFLGTRRSLNLIVANILVAMLIGAGLLLLVLPGILAATVLAITPAIVVLEDRGGVSAIGRAVKLIWQGQLVGRAFVLLGLLFVAMFVVGFLATIVEAVLSLVLPSSLLPWGPWTMSALTQCLAEPVMLIAVVLLYYDARVRRESFDLQVLVQELDL